MNCSVCLDDCSLLKLRLNYLIKLGVQVLILNMKLLELPLKVLAAHRLSVDSESCYNIVTLVISVTTL